MGKINYKFTIFNSYVSLPEGNIDVENQWVFSGNLPSTCEAEPLHPPSCLGKDWKQFPSRWKHLSHMGVSENVVYP